MKTDRELLGLAAKAAGYQVRWHENWECFTHVNAHNIDNPPTSAGQRLVWVPLTDDGDALRLAVALGIDVDFYTSTVEAWRIDIDHATESYGECAREATRRAIVRAAAAIGEAMQ